MANRVVLGALPGGGQGLRVSRPGYNVLDTSLSPKQLAFDSRWPAALRVHMAGSASFGATVYFGRSFAAPPLVVVAYTTNVGRIRLYQVIGTTTRSALQTFTDRFVMGTPFAIGGSTFSYYVMAP